MDIILISEKKNRTINLGVNLWVVILILAVIIGISVFFIYGLVNFTANEVDRTRLKQLKEENVVVREELIRIEKELLNLSHLMDSLEVYDKKLRTYASLEPINGDIRNMGIGGHPQDIDKEPNKNLLQLSQELNNLLSRAKLQSRSFKELIDHLDEKRYLRNHTPSIAPVQGWFVSGFGFRLDPFTGTIKMHEGIDIAGPIGTPIIAPADGVVKFVEEKAGFGLTLVIDHGYGFTTFYAHCQRINVSPNSAIKRGDIIAYVGDTGKATGPHLHYEVRVSGIPVNPFHYILTTSSVTD